MPKRSTPSTLEPGATWERLDPWPYGCREENLRSAKRTAPGVGGSES
jgi:hypothetical protein